MTPTVIGEPNMIALSASVLIGLVLLGAVVLMVLLLAYRRTRLLGAVLLAVGLMLMAGGAGLLYIWASLRPPVVVTDSRPLPNLPSSARQGIPLAAQGLDDDAEAHHKLGIALYAEGRRADAIQHYREALRLKPDSAVVHNNLAVVLAELGRTEEAIARYQQALRINPDNAEVKRNLQLAMTARAKTNKKTAQAETPQQKSAKQNREHSAEKPVEERTENRAEKPTSETTPPAAEPRPAWVDAEPRRNGDTYQMSITVGPYATRLECDAQLPKALQGAVDAYVETYLGPQAAGRVRLPAEELRTQLVKEEWEETIQASFGPMKQLHVLLQFDHKMRDRIHEARTNAIITERLIYTGTGVGGGLLLLAILFALLKFDQVTGGARRGRLALAALLAVAAPLALWRFLR